MKTQRNYRTPQEKIQIINEWKEAERNGVSMFAFTKSKSIFIPMLKSWIVKFGDNPVGEVREIVKENPNERQRVKLLESENIRLRRIVSDQALDIQALKEYAGRN